ncbi:hypothetical protein PHLGIDRAFT_318783 [Phlebiopsis gigantea 11061_1 CR5-6]|uniref:Uncharacterized protein n=1 Tax=Phlebiopsis gigantea (strain 11061_1 CR5-6) TaxID=745531 RepID=A0A0C3SDC0_PHLG1|nr:hypothetical protein PHLGIDRAFT_318783 [Phlebiopsis gigantea 11061_1 CR5-6]
MHDSKLVKGKAREETHWQLGWWELLPLVDGPRRPVAWSRASIIYTAHPVQPTVLAKHFSSARQFVVPSPTLILESSSAYEPPTLISISPTEDWLFAYFPGRNCDGVGCLWKRGYQLNSWIVRECFHYSQGAGVVAAEWTSSERPWAITDYGTPYRLPSRGPTYNTNAVPSLLLATQSHQLHAYFLPPAAPEIRSVKVSLLQPSPIDLPPPEEPHDPTRSHRICTHATIGLSYNEQYVIVATRSKLIPPLKATSPPVDPMDLSLHLDMSSSPAQTDRTELNEWQQWGEESSLDLSMVAFHHRPPSREDQPSKHYLQVLPLSSIPEVHMQVSDLRFVAVPPGTAPPSPTITRDPRRPTKDISVTEKGSLYLVASGLDFGEYTSLPKSQVSLFTLSRPTAPDGSWAARLEHARSFDAESGTVAFLQPLPARNKILIGILDPVGNMPSSSSKREETRVGSMSVLTLPQD